MKLTSEEKEDLFVLLENEEGYKALLKVVEMVVKAQEERVLSFPLDSDRYEQLAFQKARVEGCRKLLSELVNLKSNLRN